MFLQPGLRERTEELFIEAGNNIGAIYIHRKKIMQASSHYSQATGELLVERGGVIGDSELVETQKNQKRSKDVLLGGLMLKTGKVTFEVVEMMVHEQIKL